ncbi:TolC family protein [Mucilaginibacter arboris]|uniref:TolC family protein n=1 Tax=Mucilaginibacter arboris TaxID=2682090 RepID=A0A7K1SVK4_9SPHI|nr:TolC family protein [Mucilaginibacter arboris]MVN21372.1 TolC family protein [Mucilaginibacter arboris]
MLSLKKVWILCLLFLIKNQVYAQQQTVPISLNTLLNRINQTAPSLLTDSAAIQIRKAEANETRYNWLPNLNLNYQADIGTNNNTAGGYFGFGIIPSNSGGRRTASNTDAALTNLGIASLDWEIYNFGAYDAENKVAISEVKTEQNQFARSKYQLQAYAISNYLELLRLQNLLLIQQKNIRRNEEIRRSILSLARSGVRAGVDTSIATAELSKARLNYIELVNQSKQVQLQLSAISGIPPVEMVADTNAVPQLIASTPFAALGVDTVNHPLINYYKSLVETNRQRELLVKKSYNPKILLEGAAWGRGSSVDNSDSFNAFSTGWGFQRSNYLVGIGISYNIFDLKRRQLRLGVQKAATNYSLKALQEQQNALALSSGQANTELFTAQERLREIPIQLEAAEAAYRRNFSLYKNGLTNIVELDAALNILFRAETDYTNAKNAYCRALFQKAIAQNQVASLLNLLK